MSTSLTAPPAPSLAARYVAHDESVLLTGIQALVRLVVEQQRLDRARGRRTAALISGYEGSPLGGLDLELGRRKQLLDEHNVVHRPAVNEELAATTIFGTQLVPDRADARHEGVVGYWYGKAPGLDRATDAIRHANFGGTHPAGGAVALVGDDPSCKSSSVPSASEIAMAELAIPTFYPADSQEIIDYGLHAVALSRATGLWAGLKIVTNVADGASDVVIPEHREVPLVPKLDSGLSYQHKPTSKLIGAVPVEYESSAYGLRMDLARAYARLNSLNVLESHGHRDRIGIVASGKAYLDVLQALDAMGLDGSARERYGIRLLKLGLLFPLETDVVTEFARDLEQIVVVEDKRPFIETAIKDQLYGRPTAPLVLGKRDTDGLPLIPQDGELSVDRVAPALAQRLALYDDIAPARAWVAASNSASVRPSLPILLTASGAAADQSSPVRTPYFCSGCPHSRSTRAPEGSTVGGAIGCHSLVLLMDPKRVGDVIGVVPMGGEGAQWIGMEPFVDTPHLLQNIGDGGFFHSGSLALRAAVAANANITYKLLYNSAVAMTGGQKAVGGHPVDELTHILHAEGVARIIVTVDEPKRYRRARLAPGTDVWHRDRLQEAQETLAATRGVTVLIHDQQCATEKRRQLKRNPPVKPARRVFINERVCEGCGDCGEKSNCLSVEPVETEYGRKTRINQSSCNTDLSCLKGDCPSFLTVIPGNKAELKPADPGAPTNLPDPTIVVSGSDLTVRFTGIGGTGVVTVAQILAQAAHLAGWSVRSLDQTGLSQKAGPVISDLKLSREPILRANKLGFGECDVYIGCDILVAADAKNLQVADAKRTVRVLSLSRTPTGRMVVDPEAAVADIDALSARVGAVTRADAAVAIDARELAESACGGDQYANTVMLGAAYQVGALPLPLSSIQEAIRLNGVAVDRNLHAFGVGRQAVLGAVSGKSAAKHSSNARQVGGEIAALVHAEPGSDLAQVVADRTSELIGYQSPAYARSYAEMVERVRGSEAAVASEELPLTEAVARNLYKLMAYKDEYEVARLSLDPSVRAQIREQFGDHARFSWRFHPPVLRALGMNRKVALGRWATPLLIALRACRRLRGTPLDAFGSSEVRRTERQLIVEYRNVIDGMLPQLRPENHGIALEIAKLPDTVRGYEHVKLANVVRYRERLRGLRMAFAATISQ